MEPPRARTPRLASGPGMRVYTDLVEGRTRLPANLAPLPDVHERRRALEQLKHHPLLEYSLSRQREEEIQQYLRRLAVRTRAHLLRTSPQDEDGHELPHTNERYIALLRDQVEAVEPPTLLQVWVERISSLVPARLRALYATEMNALFLEVRDEFDDHIHDMTVRSIMMYPGPGPGAGPATAALPPADSLCGKPLGEGRTERYPVFLQRVALLREKLFITHPLVRAILRLAHQHVPDLLNDFGKYREAGVVELAKLKSSMFNDMKRSEVVVTQTWYPKIVALFSEKKALSGVPRKHWPQFLKCASNVLRVQVTELMRRSIDHFVDIMSDEAKIPFFKLDIFYAENGLELYPTDKEIFGTMAKASIEYELNIQLSRLF
ncbi:Dynein heavy chain 12, axonemal [Frankliniella fusca]|uniref:Dynein heavy chain 12, axonemal n=1 Tax=Frankliniella fusca TaxID=407009 RepID=A0AAE1LNK7_9NEOP|nr:Dynein heavy chain 12, axonemal [Frankliniella fusca]